MNVSVNILTVNFDKIFDFERTETSKDSLLKLCRLWMVQLDMSCKHDALCKAWWQYWHAQIDQVGLKDTFHNNQAIIVKLRAKP